MADAPKDGTIIIGSWEGRSDMGWQMVRWKFNRRVNKSYFGDPYESDDYDLVEDQPTHFILIPPTP